MFATTMLNPTIANLSKYPSYHLSGHRKTLKKMVTEHIYSFEAPFHIVSNCCQFWVIFLKTKVFVTTFVRNVFHKM